MRRQFLYFVLLVVVMMAAAMLVPAVAVLAPAFALTYPASFTSTPALHDLEGNDVSSVRAGRQAMLAMHVVNVEPRGMPFLAIIEVRDSDDITVHLGWTGGRAEPNSAHDLGWSWLPDRPGNYELRTFVVSELKSPRVLSAVETKAVTVVK